MATGSHAIRTSSRRRPVFAAAALLVLAAGLAVPSGLTAQDRHSLYRDMLRCLDGAGPRPPCMIVDRARGFVVLKDISPRKPDSYMIVPDTGVTGIGDPRALRPPVLAFWRYGWQAGQQLLNKPPERIGLAINSRAGRSQDLLHIHISCVAPGLQRALAAASIGPDWSTQPFFRFAGQTFNVRSVAALDPSPFRLLEELPGARADMGARSLAVIGRADGRFYVLTSMTASGVRARAESLLDQTCG